MKRKLEQNIQNEIVKWFTNQYCLKGKEDRCFIFAVQNELPMQLGHMITNKIPQAKGVVEKSVAICLAQAISTGYKVGVSDLIVLMKNRIMFVELKTAVGRQREKQKEFEEIVTGLGFEYYVIRSLKDFQDVVGKSK